MHILFHEQAIYERGTKTVTNLDENEYNTQ